ncbi:PIG-P-domain-containing protein [Microthyrium microscopicum]|uniref:PIG-P-domain-containing protein n=1 Tax=Microthyrium microscopicum TaxID=703497 RepID=A0A6A6U576_9PEZI|nr:PIG-P-domain-containing protein [Microthyrium microscopicum]
MPPQSRGERLSLKSLSMHTRSTPNLPTLRDFGMSASGNTANAQRSEKSGDTILSPVPQSPDQDENGDIRKEIHYSDDEEQAIAEQRHQSREDPPSLQQRRFQVSRNTSTNFLQPSPSQLFPPLYGRPTTPLPPSPSLTSLLRPPFSTHTSHHTTPESSDVESTVGGSTVSAVEKSAQTATTVPRADPKVPTYEYYGFALYLASSAAFLMYVLWAYLPSPFLHQLGIYYYPNRWWALAVPAWLVILVLYIYVALASYNTGYMTLPMQSIENLVDDAAQMAVVDREGKIIRPKKLSRFADQARVGKHSRQSSGTGIKLGGPVGKDIDWKTVWNEGTDAVLDIPIGGVCEILYGSES